MYPDKKFLFTAEKGFKIHEKIVREIQADIPNYDDPKLIGIIIPQDFFYPAGNMGDKTYLNLLRMDKKLRISIDLKNPRHRVNPTSPRFFIQELIDGEYKTMVTSESWQEILFCLEHWDL